MIFRLGLPSAGITGVSHRARQKYFLYILILGAGSGHLWPPSTQASTTPLSSCEAAAGAGAARLEHDLCLYLPVRDQGGLGSAVHQLLCLL